MESSRECYHVVTLEYCTLGTPEHLQTLLEILKLNQCVSCIQLYCSVIDREIAVYVNHLKPGTGPTPPSSTHPRDS